MSQFIFWSWCFTSFSSIAALLLLFVLGTFSRLHIVRNSFALRWVSPRPQIPTSLPSSSTVALFHVAVSSGIAPAPCAIILAIASSSVSSSEVILAFAVGDTLRLERGTGEILRDGGVDTVVL